MVQRGKFEKYREKEMGRLKEERKELEELREIYNSKIE